jgi:hypothetical protein
MVAVPFPLSTAPGERAQEGAGRLINCYAEANGQGARNPATFKRVPGLGTFVVTSETDFRGMLESGGFIYAVFESQVISISAGAGVTSIGNIAAEDGVFMARNNKAPIPDVVIVSGTDAYAIVSGGVITYPDSDVGAPNSVCFLDGFFFFTYGSGLCRSSGINTTDINSLDFITAESNPDGLLRAIPFKGQLLLFGQDSCEFWSGAVINEFGFPFNRVTSTPYGLAGKYAIAGHEHGFGTHLLWVSKDNGVWALTGGYEPSKVSTPDLDRLIGQVNNKNRLVASVYTANGRSVWALSSPTWTWEFDLATQKWNERKSWLLPNWRGTRTQFCFGQWMCGDTESGNILVIDPEEQMEVDQPLRVTLESGPVAGFPNRARIARIDVDVTTGVGQTPGVEPIETDPTIELSVARDLVHFDNPRLVKLGQLAETFKRVTRTRFGVSGPQGFRLRIDISDPVHVGILGAEVSTELRRN